MAKLEYLEDNHLSFWCPGCDMLHSVTINGLANEKGAKWQFNGNFDTPTFTPSILVTWHWGMDQEKKVCHSFIRNGVWEFLNDCTHRLAGKKVSMIEIPG